MNSSEPYRVVAPSQVRGARYGSLEYVLRMDLFKRSWAHRSVTSITIAIVATTATTLVLLASQHLGHEHASQARPRFHIKTMYHATLELLCMTSTYESSPVCIQYALPCLRDIDRSALELHLSDESHETHSHAIAPYRSLRI